MYIGKVMFDTPELVVGKVRSQSKSKILGNKEIFKEPITRLPVFFQVQNEALVLPE